MDDYGYPGLSPFAEAFERLRRARMLQLWLRTALWVWMAITLTWVLPIGPWSVTALSGWAAFLSGCVLAAGGGVLGLLHRRASGTNAIYAMIEQSATNCLQRSPITIEVG